MDRDMNVLEEPCIIEHDSYRPFSFCIFFAVAACYRIANLRSHMLRYVPLTYHAKGCRLHWVEKKIHSVVYHDQFKLNLERVEMMTYDGRASVSRNSIWRQLYSWVSKIQRSFRYLAV